MMRIAILAAAITLTGCASSGLFYISQARQDLQELLAVQPQIDFELTPPAYQPTKPAVAERLIQYCADPSINSLNTTMAALQQRAGQSASLFELLATPEAVAFDQAMRACFKKHGADGTVVWPFKGIKYTAPEVIRLGAGLHRAANTPMLPGQLVGCGSRGGPGYRRIDGRCAAWTD